MSLALKSAVIEALESSADVTALVPVASIFAMQPPAMPSWPFIRYGVPIVGGFEATCWSGSTVRVTLHAFAETNTQGAGENKVSDIAAAIVKAMGDFNPSNLNLIECEWMQTRILNDSNEADKFHAIVEFSITAQPA